MCLQVKSSVAAAAAISAAVTPSFSAAAAAAAPVSAKTAQLTCRRLGRVRPQVKSSSAAAVFFPAQTHAICTKAA